MFGSACSEDSKSHVVANSVDSHLHIDKSRPELHLGRKKKVSCHRMGLGITTMIISSFIRDGYTNHCGCPWTRAQIFVLKWRLILGNIHSHTDKKYEIARILTASSKSLGRLEFRVAPDIWIEITWPERLHDLRDCIIYNWDGYLDFCGQKYPFGAKHFYSTTLKPETEMIKKVWVHWVKDLELLMKKTSILACI